MKRILLILLISVSLLQTKAQKFGLIAGYHASNLTSLYANYESKPLGFFHGGILMDLDLNPKLVLRGQTLYTSFGYKNSNIVADHEEGYTLGWIQKESINYIQVPVYFLYKIDLSSLKLKMGGGPFAAFKIDEKMQVFGDSFHNAASPGQTEGPASVIGGIGVQANIEISKLFLAFEYQYGFSNVYKNYTTSELNWKVHSIGFSLGLFLK